MAKALRVRIPDTIGRQLAHLSEKTKRPVRFHIENMLGLYLDEYEEAYIARDRRSGKNATYHTSRDVRKLLDL